ncbi:hypothetical protein AB0I28_38125 [Phytomonospora sp. NPDC050363]|uniref:hypothetical protein n=1 Tax=Phytomonospora sp. NPDC050363 TaxID=3155642 RepID=UPI0033EAB52D
MTDNDPRDPPELTAVPHTKQDLSRTVLTHRAAPLEDHCRSCRQTWPCRSCNTASETLREVYRT